MPNESLALPRPGLGRRGRMLSAVLLALCLALPSFWMLATIPPLWKDIDAYLQVTAAPGTATILHYRPLYCFLSRLPLYAGYALDCWRAGSPLPSWNFFAEPILSDRGIMLLLILQHAGLCFSACFLLCSATRSLPMRFVLAILWSANPFFYAVAHCVGSETLSVILLLLLAAVALPLVRRRPRIRSRLAVLFTLLLALAILTRQINAVAAALLPIAFAFMALTRVSRGLFAESMRCRRVHFERAKRELFRAGLFIAAGLLSIALADGTLRLLSRAADIPYHSRLGYTFVWRLNFLSALPAAERALLIDRLSAKAETPDLASALKVLGEDSPGPMETMRRMQVQLPSEISQSEERFDEVLNGVARAFLFPPGAAFRAAVQSDFSKALSVTLPNVVRDRFHSTTFFFLYPEVAPQCANLVTFRGRSSAEIMADYEAHRYLIRGRNLSLGALLSGWLGLLFLSFALCRRRYPVRAVACAASLLSIGLLMILGQCLFAKFFVRYTIPLWSLTFAGIAILIGAIVDSLGRHPRN